MSDQSSPPKPKPGSLRDRIAAFENKGAPPPPQPRPKPSGLQWKPRPPSPPTLTDNAQSSEHKPTTTGGMSASDAIESIGRGGSLKERMAALQGKGAFGGPPPPVAPKPNVERPKWKPPPAVPAPVTSGDESNEAIAAVDPSGRDASRSPPPRVAASPPPDSQGTSNREDDPVAQDGDHENPDPEEEERQRRAVIAARMARLGGAKFGMRPPIFAPKPVVRKSEPAPPADEVKEEAPVDQQTVLNESSQVLVTSPPHDLATVSPEPVTETEPKNEPESPPPVPIRAPVSMPVPVGPRRPAPPRKKAVTSAPATALPEPPVQEAEGVAVQTSAIIDEQPLEIAEAADVVKATFEEHFHTTVNAEQLTVQPPALTEVFHEPAKEPEKQEAEEELVEGADSHVEEELTHATVDDKQVSSEQPSEIADVEEEDEEARRHRVAAKLVQMGAINPLAGPPSIPQRSSFDEPAPARPEELLDVEDEVNVDTEEYGETIPPPPRPFAAHSIELDAAKPHFETDQDDGKLDEDEQVSAHRDGEHAVGSYTEEQSNVHVGHTLPSPEFPEEQSIKHRDHLAHVVAEQDQGTISTQQAEATEESGTVPSEVDRRQGDGSDADDVSTRSATAEIEKDTSRDEAEGNEMPPPRVTRPIPPPPVNLRSKPTPPSSPSLSPPPKIPLHALKVDEEERPASPDMPPRPVPPPGRSGSMTEDAPSPPPRRSMPPPPRRTSVRVTDALADPPPMPTSPRPVNHRPATPPIITTIVVQEPTSSEEQDKEYVIEDETSGNATPQLESLEDEASVRRRAIAERMARLGGIRFGAPPPMNPLSRPPLPAAPPPTSIPPDETESEEREEEDAREEEEEDEVARKRRIAAKLAGMGGMRLGMLPPAAGLPPATTRRVVQRQEDSENEDAMPPVPVPAPPQRPPPTRKPPPTIEVHVEREPDSAGRDSSRSTSDDGVRVEAEESEMEEVRYSDAEAPLTSEGEDVVTSKTPRSAEALPTPPPRMTSRSPPPGRPPIPTIPAALLARRPSATAGSVSTSSSRHASLDETRPPTVSGRPQSEYVMVEAEYPDEEDAPPLRRKPTRGGPARPIPLPPPPPPSAIDPPEALTSSAQWELASIPQGPEFGEGSELASSGWSEDSTAVHVPPPILSSSSLPSSSSRRTSGKAGLLSSSTLGSRSIDPHQQQQPRELTTDELMAIWGKVGVQVIDAATTLFEKSKRALVGDGSYAGFVRAVLAQVPGVVRPPPNVVSDDESESEWGYGVYTQTGNAVQRRVSDILPGDVIAFWDAKFKGHKGLHAYTQIAGVEAGTGGPLVGIVSEFDGKKSKVRVWQANQHVGQQTVEIVSYRLDDLKNGQVKVYRVLEA